MREPPVNEMESIEAKPDATPPNPWLELRRLTSARIALGLTLIHK